MSDYDEGMPFKLRSYQIEACDFLKNKRASAIISVPAGGGKSHIALAIPNRFKLLDKILIICLSSIKKQWSKNFKSVFKNDSYYIVNNLFDIEKTEAIKKEKCVIINYDILFTRERTKVKKEIDESGEEKEVKETISYEGWDDFLSTIQWDLIICDEAHYLRSDDTERYKSVKKICSTQKHRRVTFLTATPIVKDVTNLFSLLHLIDSEKFAKKATFVNRFQPKIKKRITFNQAKLIKGRMSHFVDVWVLGELRNLDELRMIVNEYIFQVEDSVVYSHLEKMQRINVPVELKETQEMIFIERSIAKMSSKSSEDRLVAKNKLSSLYKMVGMAKIDESEQFIRDWLATNDTKLCCFAVNRDVLSELHARFSNSLLFFGGISDKNKAEIIDEFVNNDEKRIIFMNVDSATGVDRLSDKSCTEVIIQCPYTSAVLEQVLGRVRRASSTFQHYISYFLTAENSIDESIYRIVDRKAAVARAILKGEELEETDMLTCLMDDIKKKYSKEN